MIRYKKNSTSKIKIGKESFTIIPKKLLLKPNKKVSWMSSYLGAPFAEIIDKNNYIAKIYVSGRDKDNKSRVGCVIFTFKSGSISL